MIFKAIYQTKTTIMIGTSFTSTHILKGQLPNSKITYSATCSKGIFFDTNDGNFTASGLEIGNIHFIITVTMDNQWGCNIPIDIHVVDNDNNNNNKNILKYSYFTSYPCLTLIDPIVPESILYNNKYNYSLVGAPSGLIIDPQTGVISGKATNNGRFVMTITAINSETNMFVYRVLINTVFYINNGITSLTQAVPGHGLIHTKNIALKITCNFVGAPPTSLQTIHFKLRSPVINNAELASYEYSDENITFIYIIDLSNRPGFFHFTLEDTKTGYFVISNNLFTATAACFNENTTILSLINDKEVYKPVAEIEIGDDVITYKHGIKKVTHIGHNTMINNPDSISDCMYKLSKSPKYPDLQNELILLGRHSLLVDHLTPSQKRKTIEIHPVDEIDNKCLLITMFNDDFEIVNSCDVFTYYHLVLEKETDNIDRRYGVYVNGSSIIAATSYESDFFKQFSNNTPNV